eukprot:TRINITY_DN2306_c0_g2_i1.p1 TRINITY_DN2306_c0_g2~~TRINITY_DN2306_c0_g2_i1.p1  ORF type:complete len:545 (+),score=156.69 TRINITY_DN2306_c0_g2_i1:54-1637(+)
MQAGSGLVKLLLELGSGPGLHLLQAELERPRRRGLRCLRVCGSAWADAMLSPVSTAPASPQPPPPKRPRQASRVGARKASGLRRRASSTKRGPCRSTPQTQSIRRTMSTGRPPRAPTLQLGPQPQPQLQPEPEPEPEPPWESQALGVLLAVCSGAAVPFLCEAAGVEVIRTETPSFIHVPRAEAPPVPLEVTTTPVAETVPELTASVLAALAELPPTRTATPPERPAVEGIPDPDRSHGTDAGPSPQRGREKTLGRNLGTVPPAPALRPAPPPRFGQRQLRAARRVDAAAERNHVKRRLEAMHARDAALRSALAGGSRADRDPVSKLYRKVDRDCSHLEWALAALGDGATRDDPRAQPPLPGRRVKSPGVVRSLPLSPKAPDDRQPDARLGRWRRLADDAERCAEQRAERVRRQEIVAQQQQQQQAALATRRAQQQRPQQPQRMSGMDARVLAARRRSEEQAIIFYRMQQRHREVRDRSRQVQTLHETERRKEAELGQLRKAEPKHQHQIHGRSARLAPIEGGRWRA